MDGALLMEAVGRKVRVITGTSSRHSHSAQFIQRGPSRHEGRTGVGGHTHILHATDAGPLSTRPREDGAFFL